jgi:hypothetical protein
MDDGAWTILKSCPSGSRIGKSSETKRAIDEMTKGPQHYNIIATYDASEEE